MNLKAVKFDENNNNKYPSLSTNIIPEKKYDVDNQKTKLFLIMFKINIISEYSNYNGDEAPSYVKIHEQYLLIIMVDLYDDSSYIKNSYIQVFCITVYIVSNK